MEAASGGNERSLEKTPTWAVTVVCSTFVIISLFIEQAIHHFGTWLSRRNKKALYDALEKVKSEINGPERVTVSERYSLSLDQWPDENEAPILVN